MKLAGSSILVTGASGFVGPHVARALAARGATVYGLGPEPTLPESSRATLAAWHSADLRHPATLRSAIATARPDAIVHLAGLSSAARSFEHPEETFATNALGTWNLLEAVLQTAAAARVLVVGTGEAYGPQPEGTRVAEDAPLRPISPYALSKAAADAFAEVFARQHDLDVIRTRSFSHTGPGQSPTFVVPAFAQQIAAIEAGNGEPVLRVGNLAVTRDILDVRDVAEAYAGLLERGAKGAVYNVCRGEGIQLADVARMLIEQARVAVRIEPDPSRMRPADVRYLVGDPSALTRATAWRAGIPLDRTIQDVLQSFRRPLAAH